VQPHQHEAGRALLATSIASGPAAVDVTRDKFEQPPLYQRTTPTQLPAFFQATCGLFTATTAYTACFRRLHREQPTAGGPISVWNPEQTISALRRPCALRRLVGSPPTWIGVGAADRFHREDVEYGEPLKAAGVRTHVLGSLVAGEAGSGHEPGPHRDGGAIGRPRVYPEGG